MISGENTENEVRQVCMRTKVKVNMTVYNYEMTNTPI